MSPVGPGVSFVALRHLDTLGESVVGSLRGASWPHLLCHCPSQVVRRSIEEGGMPQRGDAMGCHLHQV